MTQMQKSVFPILRGSTLAVLCLFLATQVQSVSASGGGGSGGGSTATESTTSGGSGGGGGGGGGSGGSGGSNSRETGTPLYSGALTFTAAPVNGVVPICAGTYSITPYYPSLNLVDVQVDVSAMNVPDGSVLYVTVNGSSGLLITSGYLTVTGQTGTSLLSGFCLPSTTLTSVIISDSFGNVLAIGQ